MLISDIHLRDYHRYNKYPNQRLESFKLLAEDIVKIGKQRNIDTLLIGGDIVDKNTLSPVELHTLFSMFTKLASHFRIYSIIGNHDAKSKKSISSSDTVITLLKEIDGISFHHQEILEIGGRNIAFENWVPEYDLSWIEKPVDLYMSHATIDYDNTGLYGMDTSVFEGKFKYGVFGDIHVNRQIDNLISIGNTKQESLSDKDQGGVMIMDLKDFSYERVPIDPEHKKYLYITTTDDSDEEGWVDAEGESMEYKVFRPKKVSGTQFNFKLPQITDIESRTSKVMKEFGLLKLHKSIKDESTYAPVDFNFKLLEFDVENYRSVKKYNLDFTKDYVITGHNGAGKSSLLTGLFYSLIGKKSLKSEIKFGEDFCRLQVRLEYQGVEYRIKRGTAKGDYGLKVGEQELKFNSKLEFERTVIDYLPFLKYHESFFFNSWDTDLLGSLKLDKRYDLLSKYYRLDALSTYNDSATVKLKAGKKVLKEAANEVLSSNVIMESRENDKNKLEDELKDEVTEEELDIILSEQSKVSNLVKEVNKLNIDYSDLESSIEDSKDKITSQELLLSSLKKTLNTKRDFEEIRELIEERTKADNLRSRITKGKDYLESLETLKETSSKEIELIDSKIQNLGNSEKLEIPKDLPESITSITKEINSLKTKKAQEYAVISAKQNHINSDIENFKSELEDLKQREGSENDICSCCGQHVSHTEMIKQVQDKLSSKHKILEDLDAELKSLDSIYKDFSSQLITLEETLSKKVKELDRINEANKLFEKNSKERSILINKKENCLNTIKDCEDNLSQFSSMVTDLEKDFSKLQTISDEEFVLLKSDLRNLDLIKETSLELIGLKNKLTPKIKENKQALKLMKKEIEDLNEKLVKHSLLEEQELHNLKDLKYKYITLQDLEEKYLLATKNYETKKEEHVKIEKEVGKLDEYVNLTSRSGSILKSILEDLTKTFSSSKFKFTTAKVQASGKIVTDMSIDLLVGKRWVSYERLSSGQRTLCDLYYISKVVTGVGVIALDETLRFLDDESLKLASELIDSMKKNNLLISSHSSNLSMEGTTTLKFELLPGNTSKITTVS